MNGPRHPLAARSARGPRAGDRLAVAGLVALPFLAAPVAAFERTVVVGEDGRRAQTSAAYAATGRIECGGVRGVGQLTGRGDTVTSAAHVFFDEAGRSRADAGRCVFMVRVDGEERSFALRPDREACGSTAPYGSAGARDWAVARLERPLAGIRPYAPAGRARAGDAIVVVGHQGATTTVQSCRVREVVASAGGVELRTDCTGSDGMSGAAYLTPGATPRIVGVHVGFRSSHPGTAGPYAADHYTFGSALDGGFAAALKSAAR